jgi:AmmeMemoRadiSam system protein B
MFAGQFYPAGKKELTNQLKQLFESAQISTAKNKQLQALISPHAGYIFSGEGF